MCRGVCLNSNADPIVSHTDKFEQIGNKTECALLEMAYNMGFNFKKIRAENKVYNFIFRFSELYHLVHLERKCHLFVRFNRKNTLYLLREHLTFCYKIAICMPEEMEILR